MTSADPLFKTLQGSAAVFAVLSFFVLLAGCSKPGPQVVRLAGDTMGTAYSVKLLKPEGAGPSPQYLQEAVQGILDRINGRLSTYDDESELSRFNRYDANEPFPLSDDALRCFEIALTLSAQTGGAFDVTVGPIVNAYGFGPGTPAEPPSDEALAKLRERVGYELLELDVEHRTISKQRADVYCDLSAIAKGYAVDEVARALEDEGLMHYMVEVGGEVKARGRNPDGEAWQIAIEKPDPDARAIQEIVPLGAAAGELENEPPPARAMATSGDYRNFYMHDGKRISHTIDPRTGRPISHTLASATVFHESCAWADGYATALLVLGPEEGLNRAKALDLEVYLLVREGEDNFVVKTTSASGAPGQ